MRAFTLIEMMVVLMLIAVAAGMIVPRFVDRAATAALREAGRDLYTTARRAREHAVTRRRPCRLVIDAQRGRFDLLVEDDPTRRPGQYRPVRRAGARRSGLDRSIRFGRIRIALPDDAESARFIQFDPMGMATAAIVEVTDGRRTWSLVVEPGTGRARLIDGEVDEMPAGRIDLDA